MRALKVAIALGAALLVHVTGTWLFPELPRFLDLFLVVAVLNALTASSAGALFGGTAAGLVHDALSARLYGLHGFADTIVAYSAARAAQRLDVTSPIAVSVTIGLATLLQQATLIALASLFTDPKPPEPIALLVRAVANGLVGALAWTVSRRVTGARDAVRRRRRSKIRL